MFKRKIPLTINNLQSVITPSFILTYLENKVTKTSYFNQESFKDLHVDKITEVYEFEMRPIGYGAFG